MVKTNYIMPPIIDKNIRLRYIPKENILHRNNVKLKLIVRKMYKIIKVLKARNVVLQEKIKNK